MVYFANLLTQNFILDYNVVHLKRLLDKTGNFLFQIGRIYAKQERNSCIFIGRSGEKSKSAKLFYCKRSKISKGKCMT